MKKLLFGTLFLISAATTQALSPAKPADVRLYTLNCGMIDIHDGASFSDTDFYPHKPLQLADPCFLIKHNKTWMIWDLGLGDQYLGRKIDMANYGVTLTVPISLVAQLKQLNLTPKDISYVAISHSHFDHVGNAKLFLHSTWLIQRAEYQAIQQQPLPPAVENSTVTILRSVPKKLLSGDYDVFGDGSVIILRTPGHTAGHQSLEIKLAHTGTVILSGDLYHTREAYQFKQMPSANANRADTMASMARVEALLRNTNGRLIIQHDAKDFASLPKLPEFLN